MRIIFSHAGYTSISKIQAELHSETPIPISQIARRRTTEDPNHDPQRRDGL